MRIDVRGNAGINVPILSKLFGFRLLHDLTMKLASNDGYPQIQRIRYLQHCHGTNPYRYPNMISIVRTI